MNLRRTILERVLELVSRVVKAGRSNFIEIGYMFKENEVLKTFQ